MKPRAYLDLRASGSGNEEGGAAPSLPYLTHLMRVLHGVFRHEPLKFALALPELRTGERRHPGRTLRVFTEYRDDLQLLRESVHNNATLKGKIRCSEFMEVPEGFAGPFREFRRYRVPGKTSRLDACRVYRLAHAETLPYFRLTSKSGQGLQGFPVFVEPRDHVSSSPDCVPDSYGLSVAERPFALPVL